MAVKCSLFISALLFNFSLVYTYSFVPDIFLVAQHDDPIQISDTRTADPLGLRPTIISRELEPLAASCLGAKNDVGTCRPIGSCSIKELNEDYVTYKGYFCIIDRELYREVGVCCPDVNEPMVIAATSNTGENEAVVLPPEAQAVVPPPVVSINSVETVVDNEVNQTPEMYSRLGDSFICGYNGKKMTKIVGGQEAGKKDWPWMAVLLRKDDFLHYCGGVVITRRHVLTAAHCVHRSKPEDMLIRLGEYDFDRQNETRTTDIAVREIRSHQDFDRATYENDIAVLVLAQLASYGIYVQPICLPQPGPDYANSSAIVAGWGTLSYGGPMSEVLMEVNIPVWEQKQCVSSFSQTIFDTAMCAGAYEGGKDSCQGDSGGPLMVQREDNRWQTIGVVSWGVRCGEKGKPGIYTRINKYLPWLAPKIQDII